MTNFTITKNPTEFSHVKPGPNKESAAPKIKQKVSP